MQSGQETLRRHERQVSSITGAVSGLQRLAVANDGALHVYLAGDNVAAPHDDLKHLQWSLRSRSAGKGISDLQAKASGLCEALERYSGVFRGTEPRREARLEELGGLGIHPNDCMRFSDRQYEQRDVIERQKDAFLSCPVAFRREDGHRLDAGVVAYPQGASLPAD